MALQRLHCPVEGRQVGGDDVGDDVVLSVEVAVGEVIAHPGDLTPWHIGGAS
ncbi:MAG TPA: hypothetical protein VFN48_02465 [Solirubrobacteraceae bacterium]|nr:hypothetical protein [Solirubrobacteraceae bacterium]